MDPRRDGNCGFRMVSYFLYNDVEKWAMIRKEILCEMRNNHTLYVSILAEERFIRILDSYLHSKGRLYDAPYKYVVELASSSDLSTRSASRASSYDMDGFFTLRADPLGGRVPIGIYMDIASCSAVGRRLWESQERLETKVGLKTVLVSTPRICNLVWPMIWQSGCYRIERSYGVWLILTTRCQNLVPMTSLWDQDFVCGALLLHYMFF
ncbi:hypothetical protein M9H77_08290 [Catharanthus roseus]|uniref:Uncharacterized protein n=1 Tax=Catharanthus roseus TaxID=4058 RepID=A0ACC0BXJ3_CATRO|nr:hypothetical protein M9H77_08290 [Catharanthus roseus]